METRGEGEGLSCESIIQSLTQILQQNFLLFSASISIQEAEWGSSAQQMRFLLFKLQLLSQVQMITYIPS